MRIQHNIPAMNAYRNYNSNTKALQANLQKLSSGYKINKAGDDAAGLAISEKMRAQISGLEMAQKNAKDGISLVQTAEGAMTEIHTMLNRMFSLAEQSANGTYDDDVDREQLQNEFHKLTSEIDRIAKATNFNGKKLLNGDLDGPEETAETKVTSVDATIDTAANGGQLDSVKITGADADKLQKINEALDGKEITVNLKVAATALANNDEITISGLPEGIKLQYTGKDGNAHDVTDGTAIKIDSTGSGDELDTLTNDTATFNIVDAEGNTLGTMDIKFDVQAAAATGGDTKVTFAGSSDFKAEKAAGELDTGANNIGMGGATFEITATDNKEIAALNDILSDKKLTLTAAASGNTNNAGDTFANNDKITLSGDAFDDLVAAGYKIEFIAGDAANTPVDISTSKEIKFKGTADATSIAASATSVNLKISKGTDEVATLSLDLPTAGAAVIQGQTSDITFAGGTKTDELPDDAAGGTGTALRLRVGDSVETYDDIKVAIKSLKKDDLKTDLTKIKLDTKKPADLLANAQNTTVTNGKVALSGLSVLTDGDADVAMVAIKDMINQVSTERGNLGATQNRLDHTINNLSTMQENIQDAEATIRDVDVAEEMMKYTKNNILVQSAQAMLAQANQLPQGVLQLLG